VLKLKVNGVEIALKHKEHFFLGIDDAVLNNY
jgi:hypothetical protein